MAAHPNWMDASGEKRKLSTLHLESLPVLCIHSSFTFIEPGAKKVEQGEDDYDEWDE